MIIDFQSLFSNKQSVTSSAQSTNTVQYNSDGTGNNDSVSLFASVADYAGAGTVIVELQTATSVDAAGALVSAKTIAQYPVNNADLVAGGVVVGTKLPKGLEQFVGVKYTVTGSVTNGVITSGLVADV